MTPTASAPGPGLPPEPPDLDLDPQERILLADPRLAEAIALFNQGDWYPCHDAFEALWHETQGPIRPLLQGLLQVAVAMLHLERDNRRGATVLLGEGLGRLERCGAQGLGLSLIPLRSDLSRWLASLQNGGDLGDLPPLQLQRTPQPPPVN